MADIADRQADVIESGSESAAAAALTSGVRILQTGLPWRGWGEQRSRLSLLLQTPLNRLRRRRRLLLLLQRLYRLASRVRQTGEGRQLRRGVRHDGEHRQGRRRGEAGRHG